MIPIGFAIYKPDLTYWLCEDSIELAISISLNGKIYLDNSIDLKAIPAELY